MILSVEHRSTTAVSMTLGLMLALFALTMTGCTLLGDSGPVRVTAIGALHRNPERAPAPLSLPNRLLLDATAGGLVGYSADGLVEAGLAERWTVIDDGRAYIFRLREALWANGRRVRSDEVARIVQRQMNSARLRSPLRGEFRAVRDVRAITGRVIEIRLTRAQPDLLDLLAQPDMAIIRNGEGWGPWRPGWTGSSVALSPIPEPGSAAAEAGETLDPEVILWGNEASAAVAQFDEGDVAAVFGGRMEAWPLVVAAGIDQQSIQIDPVDGLFGIAVVDENGLLGSEIGRNAVGMAIDRAALARALDAPGWAARITIRRALRGPNAIPVIYPAWVDLTLAERRNRARAIVSDWRTTDNDGEAPVLRIALPAGPGATMLFARISADLGAVGIRLRRVAMSDDADLRLIDDIAPSGDPAWFVRRLGCNRGLGCDAGASALIDAIDAADAGGARGAAIEAAEEAVMRHAAYFPLAAPMRWSLARPGLAGVRANARGRHSLIRLRDTPD